MLRRRRGTFAAGAAGVDGVMEQQRLLVVVDNAESLLTDDGEWRDANWGLLVDRVDRPSGACPRLVLTSRRFPVGLNPGVGVEVVHALSLAESMLLARELPNLGRLADGTDLPAGLTWSQARAVGRTNPGGGAGASEADGAGRWDRRGPGRSWRPGLTRRVRTWVAHGARLGTFLVRGEADPAPARVTIRRSCTAGLRPRPPPERGHPVVLPVPGRCRARRPDPGGGRGNWPDLWRRFGRAGDPPDPATLLPDPDPSGPGRNPHRPRRRRCCGCRVHPGVAEAVRDHQRPGHSRPRPGGAVDEELADFWMAHLSYGQQGEEGERTWLVRAGGPLRHPVPARAAPLERPQCPACERLVLRDPEHRRAGLVLPCSSPPWRATDPASPSARAAPKHPALRWVDPGPGPSPLPASSSTRGRGRGPRLRRQHGWRPGQPLPRPGPVRRRPSPWRGEIDTPAAPATAPGPSSLTRASGCRSGTCRVTTGRCSTLGCGSEVTRRTARPSRPRTDGTLTPGTPRSPAEHSGIAAPIRGLRAGPRLNADVG